MRIITGHHKGRRLMAPDGRNTRPTSDRVREALFDLLIHGLDVPLDRATVVDCFAGSGGLGLESLSRGAAHVTFVEHHPAALLCLRRNIDTLAVGDQTAVLPIDATRLPPARMPCSLAFLDPPYHKDLALPCLTALLNKGWLAPNAWVVIETAADEQPSLPDWLVVHDSRLWGSTKVCFAQRTEP